LIEGKGENCFFSETKCESILLQKNDRACRQVGDRHSLKLSNVPFCLWTGYAIKLVFSFKLFFIQSRNRQPPLAITFGVPSAYEKCYAVVEEIMVKGRAWI